MIVIILASCCYFNTNTKMNKIMNYKKYKKVYIINSHKYEAEYMKEIINLFSYCHYLNDLVKYYKCDNDWECIVEEPKLIVELMFYSGLKQKFSSFTEFLKIDLK